MGPMTQRLATRTGSCQSLVLVGRGMRYQDGILIIDELAPSTVVVTWAPDPIIEAVSTGTLLDHWWEQKTGGCVTAVLTLMDPEATVVGPLVLQISAPVISGTGLRWDASPVSALPPRGSGACVLVLQPPAGEARHG